QIDPNPNQPRQVMGDLSELIASIAEQGILEPLVVRQVGERFQIVAGERRYQAAVQVGLRDLPVVIRDVDETEMLELAQNDRAHRENCGPGRRHAAAVASGRGQAESGTPEALCVRVSSHDESVQSEAKLREEPGES
ncbi:MAG: ParB/RepB/Spo0J family partition protein, partial [Acidobacteria bacterium]|nr:ParB/RepB/Spo0J family partition protein [Acidobacteriota bacterium]